MDGHASSRFRQQSIASKDAKLLYALYAKAMLAVSLNLLRNSAFGKTPHR